MKGKPREYQFSTSLDWTEAKKGVLHCVGKPSIAVACPPEFNGHPNIWSPEDLFIGSIEVCTMTTFLFLLKKESVNLKYYHSTAEGIAKLVKGAFQFDTIKLKLKIGVSTKDDKVRVLSILDKVPNLCLISNSITSKVEIEPIIYVES